MYIPELISAMIEYFGDCPLVEHALKVYTYAYAIGSLEGLDTDSLFVLQCAAVLHDIGIPNARKKYGSAKGPYQEAEGALITPEIAGKCRIPNQFVEKITWLVANHHTHEKAHEDPLLQILMEADYLVNMSENPTRYNPSEINESFFTTKTGKQYLNSLFLS